MSSMDNKCTNCKHWHWNGGNSSRCVECQGTNYESNRGVT